MHLLKPYQILRSVFVGMVLFYYVLGTLFLPSGDFSSLSDLPTMYQHCKQSEHHDMNVFDFVSDHLINIDGLFDDHQDGDDQRPHQNFPIHHSGTITFVYPESIQFSNRLFPISTIQKFTDYSSSFSEKHHGGIFQPPRV